MYHTQTRIIPVLVPVQIPLSYSIMTRHVSLTDRAYEYQHWPIQHGPLPWHLLPRDHHPYHPPFPQIFPIPMTRTTTLTTNWMSITVPFALRPRWMVISYKTPWKYCILSNRQQWRRRIVQRQYCALVMWYNSYISVPPQPQYSHHPMYWLVLPMRRQVRIPILKYRIPYNLCRQTIHLPISLL
jgi:hypothetical protein